MCIRDRCSSIISNDHLSVAAREALIQSKHAPRRHIFAPNSVQNALNTACIRAFFSLLERKSVRQFAYPTQSVRHLEPGLCSLFQKALERLIDFSLIAVEQLQLIVGNIVFYFDKLIKQPRLHNFGDRHLEMCIRDSTSRCGMPL